MTSEVSNPVSGYFRPFAKFDLTSFVNVVADRFEKSTRGIVRVSPAARDELVESMRPHENELGKDLSAGRMTIAALEAILRGVLRTARVVKVQPISRVGLRAYKKSGSLRIGYRLTPVDRRRVRAAMKWKCRYLGWC
jgi:hypothetical protein